MKPATKWALGLGVGIPGILILIGIIGLLVKFIMKRCRSKAWEEINSLPKNTDVSENAANHRVAKHLSPERQPLCPPSTSDVTIISDGHISIPINETGLLYDQDQFESSTHHKHTLVQIQRDRLNRLKEEENRSRPMIRSSAGEVDIRHAIDQAQKDFEESV